MQGMARLGMRVSEWVVGWRGGYSRDRLVYRRWNMHGGIGSGGEYVEGLGQDSI
jgi:hypothetical protein